MVSFEVVPRSREALIAGALEAAKFPRIGLINVPDIPRFPIRSWEACGILAAVPGMAPAALPEMVPAALPGTVIPHLRAIDFDPAAPFPLVDYFRARGISRVLVIAGDPPQDGSRRVYPADTLSFIKKLKIEMPGLRIYAAFDPYRSNIRYELDYLRAKEDAGAEGFMSQPFFDLRLLEIYAEYLEGKNIFWGISPVLSESNRLYWESRNRAVLPKNFRPDLAWNIEFGRRVLAFCEAQGFHLYLMPIRVDLNAYLTGVLGQ
jgi:methylenetetrahydrofolate reductase (NADPH)